MRRGSKSSRVSFQAADWKWRKNWKYKSHRNEPKLTRKTSWRWKKRYVRYLMQSRKHITQRSKSRKNYNQAISCERYYNNVIITSSFRVICMILFHIWEFRNPYKYPKWSFRSENVPRKYPTKYWLRWYASRNITQYKLGEFAITEQ